MSAIKVLIRFLTVLAVTIRFCTHRLPSIGLHEIHTCVLCYFVQSTVYIRTGAHMLDVMILVVLLVTRRVRWQNSAQILQVVLRVPIVPIVPGYVTSAKAMDMNICPSHALAWHMVPLSWLCLWQTRLCVTWRPPCIVQSTHSIIMSCNTCSRRPRQQHRGAYQGTSRALPAGRCHAGGSCCMLMLSGCACVRLTRSPCACEASAWQKVP